MTESSQVWHPTRKHLAPFGIIERLENRLELGWPDVRYLLRGVYGWLELKIAPVSGRCPDHLTLEQVMFGEREIAHGGRWFLLARSGPRWLLYDAPGARRWRDGTSAPLLDKAGRFPLREILDRIAPLETR